MQLSHSAQLRSAAYGRTGCACMEIDTHLSVEMVVKSLVASVTEVCSVISGSCRGRAEFKHWALQRPSAVKATPVWRCDDAFVSWVEYSK